MREVEPSKGTDRSTGGALFMPEVWCGRRLDPALPRFQPNARQALLIGISDGDRNSFGTAAENLAKLEYLLTGKSRFLSTLDAQHPGFDDVASAVAGLKEDRVQVPHPYSTHVFYGGGGKKGSPLSLGKVREELKKQATNDTLTLIVYDGGAIADTPRAPRGRSYAEGTGPKLIQSQSRSLTPSEFFDYAAEIPGKKLVLLLSHAASDAYLNFVEGGAKYRDIAAIFSGRWGQRDASPVMQDQVMGAFIGMLSTHRDLSQLCLPLPAPEAQGAARGFPGIESEFTVKL